MIHPSFQSQGYDRRHHTVVAKANYKQHMPMLVIQSIRPQVLEAPTPVTVSQPKLFAPRASAYKKYKKPSSRSASDGRMDAWAQHRAALSMDAQRRNEGMKPVLHFATPKRQQDLQSYGSGPALSTFRQSSDTQPRREPMVKPDVTLEKRTRSYGQRNGSKSAGRASAAPITRTALSRTTSNNISSTTKTKSSTHESSPQSPPTKETGETSRQTVQQSYKLAMQRVRRKQQEERRLKQQEQAKMEAARRAKNTKDALQLQMEAQERIRAAKLKQRLKMEAEQRELEKERLAKALARQEKKAAFKLKRQNYLQTNRGVNIAPDLLLYVSLRVNEDGAGVQVGLHVSTRDNKLKDSQTQVKARKPKRRKSLPDPAAVQEAVNRAAARAAERVRHRYLSAEKSEVVPMTPGREERQQKEISQARKRAMKRTKKRKLLARAAEHDVVTRDTDRMEQLQALEASRKRALERAQARAKLEEKKLNDSAPSKDELDAKKQAVLVGLHKARERVKSAGSMRQKEGPDALMSRRLRMDAYSHAARALHKKKMSKMGVVTVRQAALEPFLQGAPSPTKQRGADRDEAWLAEQQQLAIKRIKAHKNAKTTQDVERMEKERRAAERRQEQLESEQNKQYRRMEIYAMNHLYASFKERQFNAFMEQLAKDRRKGKIILVDDDSSSSSSDGETDEQIPRVISKVDDELVVEPVEEEDEQEVVACVDIVPEFQRADNIAPEESDK